MNFELIGKQAARIEALTLEVEDLRNRIHRASSHIYCIGGPLNDNKLGYSKEQLATFFRISQELGQP